MLAECSEHAQLVVPLKPSVLVSGLQQQKSPLTAPYSDITMSMSTKLTAGTSMSTIESCLACLPGQFLWRQAGRGGGAEHNI